MIDINVPTKTCQLCGCGFRNRGDIGIYPAIDTLQAVYKSHDRNCNGHRTTRLLICSTVDTARFGFLVTPFYTDACPKLWLRKTQAREQKNMKDTFNSYHCTRDTYVSFPAGEEAQ